MGRKKKKNKRKQKYKIRYQDLLDELKNGKLYGVFIDDTGSPGLSNTPKNLHPERKTWVSVIIKPSQMPEVLHQMPLALQEFYRLTGAKEFHFADIFAGRKEFKNIDLHRRLNIFRFMSQIFSIYKFPLIVQTFDPKSIKHIHAQIGESFKVGHFNLKKQEDLALLFLLIRIKWFIENENKEKTIQARVFIDEGFKKNGIAIKLPTFNEVFANSLIFFGKSNAIYPLQLADFAAYCLNKSQLIIGKSKLTSLDKEFLNIISPIAWNYQNIPKSEINNLWLGEGFRN